MVTSDLCFVSSKDLSHKFSVRYHVWRPRKLILGIFREIITRSNTQRTPSRILAKLHQCGEHIHLILFIEVLDNTKKQRNLSPKKFPTLVALPQEYLDFEMRLTVYEIYFRNPLKKPSISHKR